MQKNNRTKPSGRVKILIDYPISGPDDYRGLSFPPILWSALREDERFEVFNSLDKFPPNLDLILIMNGGSHRGFGFKDLPFSGTSVQPILRELYSHFPKSAIRLSKIMGLKKLGYYNRLMFSNAAYERVINGYLSKNPDVRIVHRLDGGHRNICKRYGFDVTVKNINQLSHLTIHQSTYSKKMWENGVDTIFGKSVQISPQKSCVILNGVDTSIFTPEGPKVPLKGAIKILHVSASSMPRKGLFRVLELANIFQDNPEIQFYLIGNQSKDPLCGRDVNRFPNMTYIGPIYDRYKLAEYYRSATIFFYPSEKDCSPNVILEAMASGLPVVTIDSGGNQEMVIKDNDVGGTILHNKNPALAIQTIVEHYEAYKASALEIIRKYHQKQTMTDSYANAFLEIIDNKELE